VIFYGALDEKQQQQQTQQQRNKETNSIRYEYDDEKSVMESQLKECLSLK